MKYLLPLFLLLFASTALLAQTQPGSGKALFFNGFSNYINCTTNNRGITNKLTVEAWIKTTNSGLQMICTKYNNPADHGFQLLISGGKAGIYGRDGNNQYKSSGLSATSVNDGKWHHVAGVINTNIWEVWVDGKLENSATFTNSLADLSNTAPLSIGNYQLVNDHFFSGEIDEVRLWNTARNATEIRSNMCRKLNPATAGLVGYYNFDEGTGTTVSDLSSFNISGNFTNMNASAWRTSGAAIGDISTYLYTSNWANAKVKIPGIHNDTLIAQNINNNAGGVHIYRINSAPNTGIPNPGGPFAYFGIFTAGINIGYTVGYKPATITCNTDSAAILKRQDNAITNWQMFGMPLNASYTYFEKPAEVHRGEYYINIRDARAKVQINGTLNACSGTPATLTATTSSSYLWNNGQTTQTISATTSGKYFVRATNALGCISSDTVFVNISPPLTANAGPDHNLCVNTPATLGTPAIPGYTYSWSPATGLSSRLAANPTVTLPNNTALPITQVYTLTATFNGCTATDQVMVTVNPRPTLNNAGTPMTCSNTPVTFNIAQPANQTYLWSPATGLSDPTSPNPTATLTNNTSTPLDFTYTLTATNAFGCSISGTTYVTVLPQPVADAGPDKALCSGGNISIGSNALANHTYSWLPATGLSNPNTASPTVTLINSTASPVTQTYTLTITNPNGCTATDQVEVTVNPVPVANAGADKTTCSNQPVAIGTSPVAGYTYSWIPASGLSNATIANPTVTLANNTNVPDIRNYLLIVTNSYGCSSADTVKVTINPLPVSNAGNDVTICSGSTTTLGTNATPGYSYSWSPATGLSNTSSANPTVSLSNSGTVPVTHTYTVTTSFLGCTTTDQVVVTIQPAVFAAAGSDKTICGGESVNIGTPALPNYTYNWTPVAGISDPAAANPVFTGTNNTPNPMPVKLYVTATFLGCSVTDSVTITVNPKPSAETILGSPSVCPGVLAVDYHIPNPGYSNYQWFVQGGTISGGQGTAAITVNWGPSGNGIVKAFSSNSFGCTSDTVFFPVIINPLLITQKPAGPTQVCLNEAQKVRYQTPIVTNGSFYTYQAINGIITSPNPSSLGIDVHWLTPGIGKLVVTETSTTNLAYCFGVSDTLYVTINPSPDTTLAINGPASGCAFSSQHIYSLAGSPGSTYNWTFNGNTLPDTRDSISLTLPAAGTYTLSVIETNSFGCPGRTISKTITATPLPGTLTINGPEIICPDNTQSIAYNVSGLPGSTYQWQVIGGTITSGNGTGQIFVDFDTSPNKTIEVIETSSGNCVGTPFRLTASYDGSEILLTRISTTEADDKTIELHFQLQNTTANTKSINIYRREAGTGASFQQIAQVPNTQTSYTDGSLPTGQFAFEYYLESQNECGTEFRKSAAHTAVKLQAKAEETTKTAMLNWNMYRGWGRNNVDRYEVYGKADNGAFTKLTEVSGQDSAAMLTNIAGRGFEQCYRIKAIGKNGAVSWSNISCTSFQNELKFYNLITPNSDGKNDAFVIENLHLYPGNEFSIYNRWGNEIFRTTDYRNDWDGKNTSDGTYYYYLKLKDGRTFKGWFEKVR